MPVRIVQSKQNARLKELRRALAHPGRDGPRPGRNRRAEPASSEALRAGLRIHCVFVAQGSEHLLDALALPPETEILLMPRELLDSALATETPQPIAALVEPPDWTWAHLLGRHRKTAPAGRRAGRTAGPRQPGHHPALRRGLRRQRRPQPARNRERLEPQGRARLGRQRLPRSPARRQRRRVLSPPARSRREDLDHHRATAPSPPIWSIWPRPSPCSSATKATACPRSSPPGPTARSRFPAPAASKA